MERQEKEEKERLIEYFIEENGLKQKFEEFPLFNILLRSKRRSISKLGFDN